MKNFSIKKTSLLLSGAFLLSVAFTSCGKDGNNDIILPPIGGYNNSDEVGEANLLAYWGFEGNGNEGKAGTAPTSGVRATYISGGVKGQALNLDSGYLYYASAIAPLTSNQPFTVSAWVQVTNNGGPGNPPVNNFPYSYFQSAIPGQLFGNITALVEAGQYKVASDTMVFKSIYKDMNGGTQDNINNNGIAGTEYLVVKKAGTSQWVNVVTTYNPAGGTGAQSIFRIYADSALVSNTNLNFENKGVNSFKYSANEIIIGGWYNNIPGKTVSTDTWTVPFTGKIDEIRVWNKLLTGAEITAIYQLGKAGR